MVDLLPDLDFQMAVAMIILAPFVGSFLGLVAERVPVGQSIVFPRSQCGACSHKLNARDLVPIVSWVLQGGRCRYCKNPVDIAYPLVEIGATIVAISAMMSFSGWLAIASCGVGWALLTVALMDMRYSRMSDAITLSIIPAGLAVAFAVDLSKVPDHALGVAIGYLSLFAVSRAYAKWRGFEGLGLGDAKLFAGAGAWVGWLGLPSVMLIAGVSALGVVLLRRLSGSRIDRYEAIPFGPYLALGTWLVWLWGPLRFDGTLLRWAELSGWSIVS